MKLNDLLALTVKQLASLQENDLYLLRILFEIGIFFFLLPLIACLSSYVAQYQASKLSIRPQQ